LSVKLVSYSQPVNPNIVKPLDLVAHCAKVSNPANQDKMDTAPKLIKYLIDNSHWSPFEMVSVCMEVTTTRDTAALGEQFVEREARLQDLKNRQNSIEVNDEDLQDRWANAQWLVYRRAKEAYEWAIENGIAKEQARAVLPEGNTKSRLYMNGTLRSWIHFVQLRSANGTQKEHQLIAIKAGEIIKDLYGIDISSLDS